MSSVYRDEDPDSNTNIFRRIYVCLGALKDGFRAGGRDLLGLDGAFMKAPYQGTLLTAMDANNGIYLVAYGIVESKSLDSWLWFLTAFRDDLELYINSNFTFITDRQKGMLLTIKRLFPSAEHSSTKEKATEYNVDWNGADLYQVKGPYDDQVVVNLQQRINPIAGRHYWENIEWPSILIPLKPHPHIGRPPKKKKKSVVELDDLFGGVKLSKKGSTVTCTNCKEKRHNKRGCKKAGGGRAAGAAASGSQPASGGASQQEAVVTRIELIDSSSTFLDSSSTFLDLSNPGVPDAPDYDSDDDISWKSSEYDQDEDKNEGDEAQTEYIFLELYDECRFHSSKLTTHDDETTHEEETNEDDTFDPIVHTPSHVSSSDDEDSDNEVEGVQATQEIEDTHVTLTSVNPDGRQQSSSVSSGFEAKTSHAVAANLSELKLKKILIDKMEANKSISRSDIQRHLYKALVDAYEADKILLDTYGDTRRSGKRNLYSTVLQEKRQPRQQERLLQVLRIISNLLANLPLVEETMQSTDDFEAPAHQEFETGVHDEQQEEEVHPLPDWDDDILYKFKECDFHRLRIQDIEDMLLLLVQGKLTNLNKRRIHKYSDPRGFIYENKDKKNRLMCIDELHKFSDGTLDDVRIALNDRLKGIRMVDLPQTFLEPNMTKQCKELGSGIDKRLNQGDHAELLRDLLVEGYTGA
ncbi:copia protein [Tanacetum coccineum]|uniref:Copia protein n=1 Tax=Tanacetum coccineum TaxID=301880 RepID=A0ABQ5HVW0_9ASTR